MMNDMNETGGHFQYNITFFFLAKGGPKAQAELSHANSSEKPNFFCSNSCGLDPKHGFII